MAASLSQTISEATGMQEAGQGAMQGAPLNIGRALEVISESLPFSIFVAAMVVAVLAFYWLFSLERRQKKSRAAYQDHHAAMERRLGHAESILEAEPRTMLIWRDGLGAAPEIHGQRQSFNSNNAAVKTARVDDGALFREIGAALNETSRELLDIALADLDKTGHAFSLLLHTNSGHLLEADGKPTAGAITMWLRDVTGDQVEMARLAQDNEKLLRDYGVLFHVLENLKIPVWWRNAARELVWVNSAYPHAVGAESAASVCRDQIEMMSGENQRFCAAALKNGEQIIDAREHKIIDGDRRAFQFNETRTQENNIVGFALDITDLDRAEDELARHVVAHNDTLNKLATGVAIFGADRRLTYYNDAYAELWQLEDHWLKTGPSDSEILNRLREMRKLPEQTDFRAWKNKRMEIYTKVEPEEDWWHLPDNRSIRVVGQMHPFGGVLYLYENVTEQIDLRSEYNSLIDVQRTTLDNLYEGVALFGSDGRLKLHNSAFSNIWKLGDDQLNDQPHIDDVIEWCRGLYNDESAWEMIKSAVTAISENREPAHGKYERPDSSIIEYSSVPLPNGATLLTFLDVTDTAQKERALHERNDALEEAGKIKTQFLNRVSYKMRTPLTSILGFGEMLAAQNLGEINGKQNEYVKDILRSSSELLNVIDGMIDLAAMDAGTLELNIEPVDMRALFKDARDFVDNQVPQGSIDFSVELEEVGPFEADPKRIRQVLFSILSNALEFAPENGRIAIGVRRTGNFILLWSEDSGTRQGHGFVEHSSSGGAQTGFHDGLSYALVRRVLELHGGYVDIENRTDGITRINCYFPLQEVALQQLA